jgi:hypothetical protein
MVTAVVVAAVIALRRLRGGRTRLTDAFFPLAFLHLGHWENLCWAWELSFVLSAVLPCVLLIALIDDEQMMSTTRAAVVAAALVAMPLCGATGLVPALPVALWFVAEATVRRHPAKPPAARVLLGGACATLIVSALYFVGYQHATWNPPSPSLRATVVTTIKTLAMGLGPAALRVPPLLTLCLAIVPVLGGYLLLRAAAQRVEGGWRPARLLVLWISIVALAASIGWGRAGLVPMFGLPQRYALLMTPAFAVTYVAAELYAPAPASRAVQGLLLAITCALLPLNVRAGLAWRDWYRDGAAAVERDIDRGASPIDIAEAHERFLYPWGRSTLTTDIGWLRDARIGPFAEIR